MREGQLIQSARQGDQAAWIRLVEEHQQAVFRLAYLILGDPDDAEDVAQDTFIRAFKFLNRYDPERALLPWLLTIAKNLARNRKRSLGRYWYALNRYRTIEQIRSKSPEAANIEKNAAKTLWTAIRRLRQADQEIIYLRYFLDLSTEATANVLAVAPGTVKSRLHRSLQRLEAIIAGEFPALREDYT